MPYNGAQQAKTFKANGPVKFSNRNRREARYKTSQYEIV